MWLRYVPHRTRSKVPTISHGSGETFGLNLRFMLIVTVFIANAIEPLINTMPEMKALFLWIFTFHMPLFVGVTGYFARTNLFGPHGNRILKQIALQYVLFQSIYSVLDMTLFQVPGITHSFFIPYLLLWFLVGHAVWRIVLRSFIRWNVRYPIWVAAAMGVFIGFIPFEGDWLGISRTFVYLPFFIIGYYFPFNTLARWFVTPIRFIAAGISGILLIALFQLHPYIDPTWLMNSFTYEQLGWEINSLAIMMRLSIYTLELLASAAFLAWVPTRKCAITDCGRRTLYVFLIHGLLIRFAEYFGLYKHIDSSILAICLIFVSVGCTIVLTHRLVKTVCHPLIEPNGEAVFGWIRPYPRRRRMKHS
ncbi:fucose 4-O-acetylase [Paenibacillus sp. SC116]|uniref:acyltransferase family protein n=1 Tax=Paenibacillus sp. SC116 TaxID=2968986 RepID=UPI00215B132C|nr:fucose 4-O-acetylase [Paenibacillus sp. SC116]MCR8845946.1 fucose 4-O-acetylase [Paenibacillus sp. SC116]